MVAELISKNRVQTPKIASQCSILRRQPLPARKACRRSPPSFSTMVSYLSRRLDQALKEAKSDNARKSSTPRDDSVGTAASAHRHTSILQRELSASFSRSA